MANRGLATELANATEVTINDGTDTYIQLQDWTLDLSHPETIEETSDAVHYFYGHQQAFFEATILGSSPEYATFVTKSQRDANGGAVTDNWVIAIKDVSGTTKTFTLTATLAPNLRVEKPIGGAVKKRFRARITEAVTSADIT